MTAPVLALAPSQRDRNDCDPPRQGSPRPHLGRGIKRSGSSRGSCQDLMLHPQPSGLRSQFHQFLALGRAQAAHPPTRVQSGLLPPALH